jgi:hypothetical protein
MRSLRLAILPLLIATSLAAQTPAPSSAASNPVAVVAPQRTAFFDVAALVNNRQRFGLEPLIFGRWALGLIGSHYSTGAPVQVQNYNYPLAGGPAVPTTLCPIEGCPSNPVSASSYNAWSLDLAVRYYPAALSFNDPRRRLMVYIGEFVGYQWRTITQALDLSVPLPAGSGNTAPPCVYPGCGPIQVNDRTRITGWEPGAEVGVRLKPLDPLFVDVGGWFKLVTVDDPTQRIRPGQLDARLVVAVGIGW